jgi:hypothetical protein
MLLFCSILLTKSPKSPKKHTHTQKCNQNKSPAKFFISLNPKMVGIIYTCISKNSICFLFVYCHPKTKIAGKKNTHTHRTYNNNAAIKLFGKTKTSLVSRTNRKVNIRVKHTNTRGLESFQWMGISSLRSPKTTSRCTKTNTQISL